MPAAPAAVAAYLMYRAEQGASVATVRMARAAISAAHRQGAADDPCRHPGVAQVLKGLSRSGKGRGRSQVQGLDWRAADLAAGVAANGGRSLAGLRDAALIQVMSDALLRVSEAAALDVADVQRQVDGSGTVTVRSSKTDQEGRGHVRYLGAPTMQRLAAGLSGAGSTAGGPLFRQVLKDGATVTGRLGARSIRSIIAKRAAAAGVAGRVSGHSLRVGSAQSLAAAGRRPGRIAGSGRLAGADHAGALRTPPARSTRRRRQAPLPGGPVGAQGSQLGANVPTERPLGSDVSFRPIRPPGHRERTEGDASERQERGAIRLARLLLIGRCRPNS